MTQLETLLLQQLEELTKQFSLQSDDSIKQFRDLQQQLTELQQQLTETNRRLTQEKGTSLEQATRIDESLTAQLPILLKCRDCQNSLASKTTHGRVKVNCGWLNSVTYDSEISITHCSQYQPPKAQTKQK